MPTLTVTAKGQITLKQELLKHLGVAPGAQIEVDKLPGGRISVRAVSKPRDITRFVGCLARKGGKALTLEEINEIAAQGWAKKK